MKYARSTMRLVEMSQELRPTRPASQRPLRDLVTADRMLRKLRGQLASGMALGPTRRAVLGQAAADAANRAMGNPADAALDRACERLLDELDSDAEQLLPFDTAASIIERATLQRRRSLRNSPPSDER